MELGKLFLEILRNIPPSTFLLLLFLLLFRALIRRARTGPRQRRRVPHTRTPYDEETYDEDAEAPYDEETYDEDAEAPYEEETLSSEERKGQRGEDSVAEILRESVAGEFELLRNVYVPYGNGTTEVDLLLVHEKGIFVFESKNYTGLISGSMDALNWMHIHPNRKKYPFYNPVRQNRTHIQALSKYLAIPEENFYSYIVFSKRCKLERAPENTRSVVITRTPELGELLEDTLSALPTLYDAGEVRRIAERLAPLTDVDKSVKEKHIADIRNALESDACPRCGKKLVVRRGKYGAFVSCSGYPRCTFKRNIAR